MKFWKSAAQFKILDFSDQKSFTLRRKYLQKIYTEDRIEQWDISPFF